MNTNLQVVKELNENKVDYLVMRGLHSNDLNKDIDILLSFDEVIPNMINRRILHFQYEERHKGLVFVPQSALQRKVWNGEYWELCFRDKIRMKVLRFTKLTYNFFVSFFLLLKEGVTK